MKIRGPAKTAMQMPPLKAVLFDHDGTLVDSEKVHFCFWREALARHGAALEETEFRRHFVGVPGKYATVGAVQRHGLQVTAADLTLQKNALCDAYLASQAFPLMPGVPEAVAALHHRHGLRLAIVTGGGPEGVLATLRAHPWAAQSFDTVVSAADVEHSKPAPDVYLLALRRLGLRADEAIAFEDTAAGVAAASAAGLRCVAVTHEHSAHQDFSAAAFVCAGMGEALAWLQGQPGWMETVA